MSTKAPSRSGRVDDQESRTAFQPQDSPLTSTSTATAFGLMITKVPAQSTAAAWRCATRSPRCLIPQSMKSCGWTARNANGWRCCQELKMGALSLLGPIRTQRTNMRCIQCSSTTTRTHRPSCSMNRGARRSRSRTKSAEAPTHLPRWRDDKLATLKRQDNANWSKIRPAWFKIQWAPRSHVR